MVFALSTSAICQALHVYGNIKPASKQTEAKCELTPNFAAKVTCSLKSCGAKKPELFDICPPRTSD